MPPRPKADEAGSGARCTSLVYARTDAQRGVWKAAVGHEATLANNPELTVPLTDRDQEELNPRGIHCLRRLPSVGTVIWGARTLQGDDRLASDWKYVPIRRLALFLEESLYRGTQWAVFEPNDEPLGRRFGSAWGRSCTGYGSREHFRGARPAEGFLVRCDPTTMTQDDIDSGRLNIEVGFAPVKLAEFVVIRIQQRAGASAA